MAPQEELSALLELLSASRLPLLDRRAAADCVNDIRACKSRADVALATHNLACQMSLHAYVRRHYFHKRVALARPPPGGARPREASDRVQDAAALRLVQFITSVRALAADDPFFMEFCANVGCRPPSAAPGRFRSALGGGLRCCSQSHSGGQPRRGALPPPSPPPAPLGHSPFSWERRQAPEAAPAVKPTKADKIPSRLLFRKALPGKASACVVDAARERSLGPQAQVPAKLMPAAEFYDAPEASAAAKHYIFDASYFKRPRDH